MMRIVLPPLVLVFVTLSKAQLEGPVGPPGHNLDKLPIPEKPENPDDALPPGHLGIPEENLIYPELATVNPPDLEVGKLLDPGSHFYSDPTGPIAYRASLLRRPSNYRSRESDRIPSPAGPVRRISNNQQNSRVSAPAKKEGPTRQRAQSDVPRRSSLRYTRLRNTSRRRNRRPYIRRVTSRVGTRRPVIRRVGSTVTRGRPWYYRRLPQNVRSSNRRTSRPQEPRQRMHPRMRVTAPSWRAQYRSSWRQSYRSPQNPRPWA